MSNGERSVYWPIMVAASIGALGTVAAAVIQRPELVKGLVAEAAPRARHGRVSASPPGPTEPTPISALIVAPTAPKPTLPAHWIDAKGRYYEVKPTGDRFGIIAYKGGADAVGYDQVRMVGEGTLSAGNGAIRWSWQGQHGDKIEECVGNESPSAIAVSCTRPGHGGYALRLVVR